MPSQPEKDIACSAFYMMMRCVFLLKMRSRPVERNFARSWEQAEDGIAVLDAREAILGMERWLSANFPGFIVERAIGMHLSDVVPELF